MQIRRPLPHRLAAGGLALGLALVLAACGHEDDERAGDPTGSTSADPTPSVADSGGTREWPDFAPADYTYRLEVLCFCPQTGPLQVTVSGGEVTSAVRLQKPGKGDEAPEFGRLTINDIIAKANDPKAADADVTWPEGTDHPTKVAIDQIRNAVDDEVTYVIGDVVVSAG